jgi:AcrR family transcriptional regulator
MSTEPSQKLRIDARQNRDRIIEAARTAYAVDGIDAPVTAIARRAGVGVATLYRRFPTRSDLLTAAFAEQLARCDAMLEDALEDPDPWRALRRLLVELCTIQATNRAFSTLLAQLPDWDREFQHIENCLAILARRAKDAGHLREDFDPTDIRLLLLANSGVVSHSREISLAASRRLVAYLLQAFQTGNDATLPPPPELIMSHLSW